MTIKKYIGRVAVLGDSLSSMNPVLTQTTYSYAEMEGGELIRRLKTPMGLDGHLKAGYRDGESLELHVNEVLSGVPDPGSVLLAIRRGNGRLYAFNVPGVPFFLSSLSILFFVLLGFMTIWIFGLGLVFWFLAWKLGKARGMVSGTRRYIEDLGDATLI